MFQRMELRSIENSLDGLFGAQSRTGFLRSFFMSEIWKDIPCVSGRYEVSDQGRVKNSRTGHVLKLGTSSKGYKNASLCGKTRLVHRLVMEAFHGKSEKTVHHINEIKDDNRLENLCYMTHRENTSDYHARRTKTYVGVRFNKILQRYETGIVFNRKNFQLGYFQSPEDARSAYERGLAVVNSDSCDKEDQLRQIKGPIHQYKGKPRVMIDRVCECGCGVSFSVKQFEVKRGWGRFATKTCANRIRNKGKIRKSKGLPK